MPIRIFTDMMNREVGIPFPPQRIISLVPSQTELLYDLDLEDRVVGQTLFCIHPSEMHAVKPRIGGTKKINVEKIRDLQPDLIIGNKEENEQKQIEELMKEFPVWMSDIKNLDDSFEMIKRVGQITDTEAKANSLALQIYFSFQNIIAHNPKRAAYFIWRNPWMVAASNTFIDDMMQRINLVNVFSQSDARYPEVHLNELNASGAEIVLLSSEPYPFSEKHIAELQLQLPNACILLVDGELFSWYGSRLQKSAQYFTSLLQQLDNHFA